MKSFPWDSIATSIGEDGFPVYDRPYTAEDLASVYETFFSDGVFMNDESAFVVTPSEGMNVVVSAGKCCIKGTVGWEDVSRVLALQAPSDQDRIDTIVLRRNANKEEREIDLYVKQGTPATTPQEPSLIRNDTVYELGIANIYVASNDDGLSAQRISDTRLDDSRCGMVTPLLDVDTTTFYNQLHAQTNVAVELANAALAGTIPGQLQEQIDEINTDGWVTSERVEDGAIDSGKLGDALKDFLTFDELKVSDTLNIVKVAGIGIIRFINYEVTKTGWHEIYTIPDKFASSGITLGVIYGGSGAISGFIEVVGRSLRLAPYGGTGKIQCSVAYPLLHQLT